ncbi:HU family DNA-binding protein [Trichlorobacter lovleyi]|uniref:Histone family protein DNA-binding protein n=1 Tax=Trichlorobacter lovleyi (strain ATCC BAA-1151 / DSM 17278 / SZ) TaxID=398767 RepID=B3EBU7_TRIL1|nr:HU family DNA-binding protein [Trichlorobacter lovleyi]ACD97379.1 hypothetical protein Glov_3680 [Trichlorobacter lovleyi SZ]
MALTKIKLARILAANLKIHEKVALQHITDLMDLIKMQLIEGNEVAIVGFGILKPAYKLLFITASLEPFEPVSVQRRKIISFTASLSIKKALNLLNAR